MRNKFYQWLWMSRAREYRGALLNYCRELEQNESFSTAQMRALQWQKQKRLLEHAYTNVPFYQRRFKQIGLHPDDIKTSDDWRQIPILTRQDIQENLKEMTAATHNSRAGLIRDATGGSTGTPMNFYVDSRHKAYHQANKMRMRRWAGYDFGDKVALLWGADRDIPTRSWWEQQKILYLRREKWLNAFKVTSERMARFAVELIRWQPKYILAYASSAALFAGFLKEQGIDTIRPTAVETSADKLHPHQRRLIEEVFACKVFDFYGSREIGSIAAECEQHNGLHIFSDVVYVEVLQNGQPVAPGEMGEVIVTNLVNDAMPFIRYRNGDLARLGTTTSCTCGRPYPLLSEIVGRAADALVTPAGATVHGEFLSHIFYDLDEVKQYQAHQKSVHQLDIDVESRSPLTEAAVQALCQKIAGHLGVEMTITVRQVAEIPRTETGKYRYVISDVPLPYNSKQ